MASSEVLDTSEIDPAEAKSEINPERSSLEKKMNGHTLDLLEERDDTLDAPQDPIDIVSAKSTHANGIETQNPSDASNDATVEAVNLGGKDLDEVLNGDGNESDVTKATSPSEVDETIPLVNGSKDLDTVSSPKAFENANLVDVTEEYTGTESVTAPVSYPSLLPESEAVGGTDAQHLDTNSTVKVAAATEQHVEPIKENTVLTSNDVGVVDAIPVAPDTVEAPETVNAEEGWEPLTEGIKPVEEAVVVEDETKKETEDATEEADIEEAAKQPLEAHAVEPTTTLDITATEEATTETPQGDATASEDIAIGKEAEAVLATSAPEFSLTETVFSTPEVALQEAIIQDVQETSAGETSDTPAPGLIDDPVSHATVVSLSAEDTEELDEASADVAGTSPAVEPSEEISIAENPEQSVAQGNEVVEQNVIEIAKDIGTKAEEEEGTKEGIEGSGVPEVQTGGATDIGLDSEVKPEAAAVEDFQIANDTQGDAANNTPSAIIPDVIDPIPAAPDTTEEAAEPLTEGDNTKESLVEDIKQEEVAVPVEQARGEHDASVPVDAEVEETEDPEVQAVEAVAIEPESEVESTVPEAITVEEPEATKDAQEDVGDDITLAVVSDAVDPIPAAPDTVEQIVNPPVGAEESLNIEQEEVAVPMEDTKSEPVPIEASVAHVNENSVDVGEPVKKDEAKEANRVMDTDTETHVEESLKEDEVEETASESVVVETEEPISQEAVKEDLPPSVPSSEDQPQTPETILDNTPIKEEQFVPDSETAEVSIGSDSQTLDGSAAETAAATEKSAVDATIDDETVPVDTKEVADASVVDAPERKEDEEVEEKVPVEETEFEDSIKDEAGENAVTAGDNSEGEAEEAEEPEIVPRRARALTVVNVTVEQEVHVHDLDPHAPAHAQVDVDSAANEAEDVEDKEVEVEDTDLNIKAEPVAEVAQVEEQQEAITEAEEASRVATDDAASSHLDIEHPTEIERPKSPWTPSYSVTNQGPGIAAEEDIPEIEQLSSTAQTEEASEASVEVPVVNVVIPDTAEGEVDTKVEEKEELERPKSPWTPSYSVSQQGSPAPAIKGLEETAEAAPEEQQELEPVKTSADVVDAPVEEKEVAAEAEVDEPAKVDVPAVVIPVPEQEDKNDEATESAEESVRPKSPWTPSYSVSQQGSPAPPVSNLPTAPVSDLVAAIDGTLDNVKAKEDEEPVTPEVQVSQPDEAAIDETVVEARVDVERPATPGVRVSEPEEDAVPPTSEVEQAAEGVTQVGEERPKSPWTQSYSVSRQGSPQPSVSELPVVTSDVQLPTEETKEQTIEKMQADTDPRVEEAIVTRVEPEKQAEEAESVNASDFSATQAEEQTKTTSPTLQIPEAPVAPEAESKSSWTPSYSVTTQGSDTMSEEIEVVTTEAQETIVPIAAATQEESPSVAATSLKSLTVDTNAAITPDRPQSPWTPSYSVMRQGSGVVDERNDEAELDQLEKLPEPANKNGGESSVQNVNTTETVTVQPPDEGDKAEAEKNTEAFPSTLDDQRSLTSLDTVTKDDPLPSPTGRSRLESTASSLIFPGGWFSKAPLGRMSLDNAKGEFATSKPTSPVETTPELEDSGTPTNSQPKEAGMEATVGEAEEATSPTSTTSSEKRSKWCTIM